MMFCALTNHVIRKKNEVIEEHIKGRKFKMAQGNYDRQSVVFRPIQYIALWKGDWMMLRKLTIFRD
jgi:hypothetical protein